MHLDSGCPCGHRLGEAPASGCFPCHVSFPTCMQVSAGTISLRKCSVLLQGGGGTNEDCFLCLFTRFLELPHSLSMRCFLVLRNKAVALKYFNYMFALLSSIWKMLSIVEIVAASTLPHAWTSSNFSKRCLCFPSQYIQTAQLNQAELCQV